MRSTPGRTRAWLCLLLALFPALAVPASGQEEPGQAPPPPDPRTLKALELVRQGQPEAAVSILEEVLADEQAAGDTAPFLLARTLNNLSRALAEAGRLEEAIARGREALEVAASLGDPNPGTAEIRMNLAEFALRKGDLDAARDWSEAASRDMEKVYGRTPMAADAHELAARVALARRDRHAARKHLTICLAIREVILGPVAPATARALSGMATVLEQDGRPALAAGLHLRAAAVGRNAAVVSGGSAGPGVWTWQWEQLAAVDLLARLGGQQPAREALEPVLAALGEEAAPDHLLLAAGHLLRLGFPHEALDLYGRAERGLVDRKAGATERLRALIPAVRARELAGDLDGALAVAREALALTERELGQENELRASILDALGRIRLARGEDRQAMDVLRKALDLRRRALGEEHPALLGTFALLATAEERLHGPSLGLLDLSDMARRAARRAPLPMLAAARNEAWWQEGGPGEAALVRARLRLAAARRDKALAPAVADLDRRSLLDPVVALAGWIGSAAEAAGSWREAAAAPGVELHALRAALARTGERLLVLAWTGEEVWGVVLGADRETDRIEALGEAATLAPLLAAAEAGFRNLEAPPDLAPLSKAILAPLWPALRDAGRVVVVGDGPLAFLPLEALPRPEGPGAGEPWVLQARLRYAPSLSALLDESRDDPRIRAGRTLRLASPDPLPEDTPSLRWQWLRDRFAEAPAAVGPQATLAETPGPEDVFLAGEDVRESALAAASEDSVLAGFRRLRLELPLYLDADFPAATGLLCSPEAESGAPLWERADGVLSLQELAAWRLDADLVLLPLVSTGPDPGGLHPRAEGLHTLVTALGRAGARAVCLAGWTTPSPAAAAFDRRLRARCRQESAGLADALAEVQRAWLRNPDAPKHPGIWARWRLFRP